MALSTRELYLILRARDEASRVLRAAAGNIRGMGTASQQAAQRHIAQGQALITVGTGIAFAGAAGLKFFNDATEAASQYNTEARKTLTQVDQAGVKLETLKRIGIDVASAIPAPFEQMQSALYDIFSSMDVGVKDSQVLLTAFSKAAVAGQTDLQTAARGTITVLNAYKMPASNVNRVNDVMFQLVRKGVGTYEEFAKAIGRAIPSSVRAGQSFEQLAGMMAFMTRNGLSTQMAATSAARALDALAHPKTVERMQKMGISVKDANGQFRPMVDIVGQLSAKLKNMTGPERAKALQELFKSSGGTIQARRFFDLAIANFDELDQRVKEMKNSAGVAEDAYRIMFDSPQARMQAFNNQMQIMKVTVGEALLPMKLALIGFLTDLLAAWNALDPKTQRMIAKFLAFAAAAAVVVGIVTAVVGGILMLAGAAALAGVSLATVGVIILGIAFTIGLWIAAIIMVVKYHEQIMSVAKKVWTAILNFIQPVLDWLHKMWNEILNVLLPAFQQFWVSITNGAKSAWMSIQQGLEYLKGAFEDLQTIADALHLDDIFHFLGQVIRVLAEVYVMSLVYAFKLLVDMIGGVVGPIIQWIGSMFEAVAEVIAGVIKVVAGLLTGDWAKAWQGAKMIVEGFRKGIEANFRLVMTLIFNILASIAQYIHDKWIWIKNNTLQTIASWGSQLLAFFRALPGKIIGAAMSLGIMLGTLFRNGMQAAIVAVVGKVAQLLGYVRTIPGRIRSALGNLGGLLYSAGRSVLDGFINGVQSGISRLRGILNSVTNMIPSWKGPKQKDLKLLEPTGGWVMSGLIRGFQKEIPELRRVMGSVTDEIPSNVNVSGNNRGNTPPDFGNRRPGDGPAGVVQHFTIYTQEIDPRQHGAQLGYEVAKKVSK